MYPSPSRSFPLAERTTAEGRHEKQSGGANHFDHFQPRFSREHVVIVANQETLLSQRNACLVLAGSGDVEEFRLHSSCEPSESRSCSEI